MMIPIVKIKKMIEGLLEYVVQDFKNTPDEKDTFLYKVLNGTVDGNFDFYQQAKKLFTRTENDPKMLRVVYEYPKDRNGLPVYVIREPGKLKGPANSIGKIDTFIDAIPQYRDSRQSEYEIVCFSDNMMESILMSEVMYVLLVASYDTLADQFITIEYSIKELMVSNELMPLPIFIKSIALSVSDDQMVPGLVDSLMLGKILFGKVNQEDSFALGEGNRLPGLPGVDSEIIGSF